ncbi:MAG: hypothetical protein IPN34_13520 [Planctomycetes bacterium]|nr:hypothetical protein [Planctomycetota bacterium]
MLALAPALAAQSDERVTLNVRDEPLSAVLEGLAVQHRLNLVSAEVGDGRVTINLYDVPLEEALRQVLASKGFSFVKEGSFYRVLSSEQRAQHDQALDAFETKVFALNHLTAFEAQTLVQPMLSEEGSAAVTGGGGLGAPGGNNAAAVGASASAGGAALGANVRQTASPEMLIVRERRSRIAEVAKALKDLDQPPRQVLLEATILQIDLGEENRLGIDFNVLTGTAIGDVVTGTDMTGLPTYDVPGSALADGVFSGRTFDFTASPPAGGLSIGYVGSHVAAFLEALEETTNATIVNNPRVLAVNRQEAQIIVGGRVGYSTVTQNDNSSIEQINFLDVGSQLVFTPYIADDGWIRLDVHPQNSSAVVDPVSGVPSESTTEVTTSVMVRDGQSVVIGGLIAERVSELRSQIPFLGSLPVLGVLFGRTEESLTRTELVILLTPRILDAAAQAAEVERARERFSAARSATWENLSWYLRPVQARRCAADAEVLRARGDLRGALSAAERATTLDPTNVSAALMRQDLLKRLALERAPEDEVGMSLGALRGLKAQLAENGSSGGR